MTTESAKHGGQCSIMVQPVERAPSAWRHRFAGVTNCAAGLVFSWLVIAPPLSNAADFGLSASVAPTSVVVSNTLGFTINVTNISGVSLTNVFVTNVVSAPVSFVGASNSLTNPLIPGANPITVNSSNVIFRIDTMAAEVAARLTLNISPTQPGRLTNSITVGAASRTTTLTNALADVFLAQADLLTTIEGPTAGVVVNDQIVYTLAVTNRGPDAISGVALTNTLPTGFHFLSVSPTNQFAGFTNGVLSFNLGTLANGAFARFQVAVRPTNAGSVSLAANVTAPGVLDTNLANNIASLSLTVGAIQTGQVQVALVSTQRFNPQTSLTEQVVRVSNTGAVAVAAVRVNVLGLTNPNRLYNAVGTNNGNPFVVHAATLASGQSVDLLLEFFVPTRLPVTGLTYEAVGVPAVSLAASPGTSPNITKVVSLPNGGLLIEFASVPGRSYRLLYSGSSTFSNPLAAQPSILATANRVQWIDDGPPKTVSRVSTVGSRFYRVIEIP